MANPLTNFVQYIEKLGVYEVALPFILVFTLAFAVLERSHILGKDKKNLNVIISLVLALFFIRNQYLVALVNRFLPNVSLFMIVILMTLLLFGIIYGKAYSGLGGSFLTIGAILSVIFIIWSLSSDFVGRSGINVPRWLTDISPETKSLIFIVGGMLLLIWWTTKGPKETGGSDKSFVKRVNDSVAEGWK